MQVAEHNWEDGIIGWGTHLAVICLLVALYSVRAEATAVRPPKTTSRVMYRGCDGVVNPICCSVPLPVMNSSTTEVRKPIIARRPTHTWSGQRKQGFKVGLSQRGSTKRKGGAHSDEEYIL